MDLKEILTTFFDEIVEQIKQLKPLDIKKLESGNYGISIKIVKKNKPSSTKVDLSEEQKKKISNELLQAKTRDEGLVILDKYLMNKKQLESFAKANSVFLLKQDRVEKVREKIIEGLIGARLRSDAIQGKK